jgi:hypothetical protein
VERSDDRERKIMTPSRRIADKLERRQDISSEELRHLRAYAEARIREDPSGIRWRSLLTSLIRYRAKG